MNKRDIQDRMKAIDNRLKEFPAICESEKRELNEAETKEKNNLIAERASLKAQLDEIESRDYRPASDTNKSKFSLLSSVRSICNGDRFEGDYADECREIAKRSGLFVSDPMRNTIYMKTGSEKRTLDGILTAGNNFTSNTYNGGKEMVREDVLPIKEAIYNFTVLEKGGANFYNDLVGNTKIPVMSQINFGFKAENAAADVVTPTMGKVELAPKRLTGALWLSKMLLNQTSEDLEERLRISTAKAAAQALEKAIFGYGTSPHNGVMYNATTVALASLTYDTILAMAESLYGLNYSPTFILDAKAARFLKQKPKLTYGIEAIMAGGRVDDEPTFITNSIDVSTATSGAITCADFSSLHIGTWGGLLEITVDTVTKAAYGEVGLILNYYCDWGWDAANGTAYASREITNA